MQIQYTFQAFFYKSLLVVALPQNENYQPIWNNIEIWGSENLSKITCNKEANNIKWFWAQYFYYCKYTMLQERLVPGQGLSLPGQPL